MTKLGAPSEVKSEGKNEEPIKTIQTSIPMFVAVHSSPLATHPQPMKPVSKGHESTVCALLRLLIFIAILSALLAAGFLALHAFGMFRGEKSEVEVHSSPVVGFVPPQVSPLQGSMLSNSFTDITKESPMQEKESTTVKEVERESEEADDVWASVDESEMPSTAPPSRFLQMPRATAAISAPPTPVVIRTPPQAAAPWEEYERRRVAYENQLLAWRVRRLQQMLAVLAAQQQQREAVLTFALMQQQSMLQQAAYQLMAFRRQAEIQEYWRNVAATRPHDAPAEQIVAHLRSQQQLLPEVQQVQMFMQSPQQQQPQPLPVMQPLMLRQPQVVQPLLPFPHTQATQNVQPMQPIQEAPQPLEQQQPQQAEVPQQSAEVVIPLQETSTTPSSVPSSEEKVVPVPTSESPLPVIPTITDRIYQRNLAIAQQVQATEAAQKGQQPQIFTSIPQAAQQQAAPVEQPQQPNYDQDAIYNRLQRKSMQMQKVQSEESSSPLPTFNAVAAA